jgi:hypothetical protein
MPVLTHLTKFCCLILITLSACGGKPTVTPTPGTPAPDFTLKDQYDHEFRLSQFRGENLLLLGCDLEGVDESGEWFNLLNERYANTVKVFPLFDASSLPFFARMFMKGKIKSGLRGSPDEPDVPRILLDWGGDVSRKYGMPPQRCTLVLVDRAGRIQLVTPLGEMDEESTEALFDLIDPHIAP